MDTWTARPKTQPGKKVERQETVTNSPGTQVKILNHGQKDLNSTHESWVATTTVSSKLASLECLAEEDRQGPTGIISDQNLSGECR